MSSTTTTPRGVPTRPEFREVIARALAEHAGPVKALRGRALVDELAAVAHELACQRFRDERNRRKRKHRAGLKARGESERRRAA